MPLSAISARGDINLSDPATLMSSLAEGGGPRVSVVEGSPTRRQIIRLKACAAPDADSNNLLPVPRLSPSRPYYRSPRRSIPLNCFLEIFPIKKLPQRIIRRPNRSPLLLNVRWNQRNNLSLPKPGPIAPIK